jgi:hypothetical protein
MTITPLVLPPCHVHPVRLGQALRARLLSRAAAGGLALIWALLAPPAAAAATTVGASVGAADGAGLVIASVPADEWAAEISAAEKSASAEDVAYVTVCVQALRAMGALNDAWQPATTAVCCFLYRYLSSSPPLPLFYNKYT